MGENGRDTECEIAGSLVRISWTEQTGLMVSREAHSSFPLPRPARPSVKA